MSRKLILLIMLAIPGGCTVRGDYTCGVPETGVRCQPMNATHQQLNNGSLRSLHTEPFPDKEVNGRDNTQQGVGRHRKDDYIEPQPSMDSTIEVRQPSIESIHSKQALLSQPRELRIWFDRFTDPDGDLHDESFVFIRIDNGHWVIDNKPVLY